jgi:uncharacterized protein YdgA (DUF945 family)
MKKIIISVIVTAIIFGGGGFYLGKISAKSSSPQQMFRNNGTRSGAGANAGFVTGQIVAKDSSSVTIQLRQGGSKIIFYSSATDIGKIASGTPADLQIGQNITATGQTNSDGSLNAQSIQLR